MTHTCKQPDRDVPKLVCGYPLPCPHHTVMINAADGSVSAPKGASPVAVLAAHAIAPALVDRDPLACARCGKPAVCVGLYAGKKHVAGTCDVVLELCEDTVDRPCCDDCCSHAYDNAHCHKIERSREVGKPDRRKADRRVGDRSRKKAKR